MFDKQANFLYLRYKHRMIKNFPSVETPLDIQYNISKHHNFMAIYSIECQNVSITNG